MFILVFLQRKLLRVQKMLHIDILSLRVRGAEVKKTEG